MSSIITTPRFDLIAADPSIYHLACGDRSGLSESTGAQFDAQWPIDNYDREFLDHCTDEVQKGTDPAMLLRFIVEREPSRRCVGTIGTLGQLHEGAAIVGYSVAGSERRRGIASEALHALREWLFAREEVSALIAFTHLDNVASRGVLEKCGFEFLGAGEEEGTIQYRLNRSEVRQ